MPRRRSAARTVARRVGGVVLAPPDAPPAGPLRPSLSAPNGESDRPGFREIRARTIIRRGGSMIPTDSTQDVARERLAAFHDGP
jgi:hypothetical protein